MRKKTITKKDVLSLSISLFVVTTAWIGFNLYHTYVTSTISSDLQEQIIPIAGQFDTTTIQQLKKRTIVTPIYTKLTNQYASQAATQQEEKETNVEP